MVKCFNLKLPLLYNHCCVALSLIMSSIQKPNLIFHCRKSIIDHQKIHGVL